MRALSPAARALFDSRTGALAVGSFEGALPRVSFDDSSLVVRTVRRKKWVYVAIASPESWISLGVVRTGYAATAFAFVFERASGRMLVDRTILAGPRSAAIADDPHAIGALARFGSGRTSVLLDRHASGCNLRARLGELDLDVSFDEASAPPSISAIADLGQSLASATEKRALALVRGTLTVSGQRTVLDGAFGGYDYTHGLLPRRTRWHWAFGMGHTKDGRPVGFNVVEGFVGEAECAAFFEGRVHPLGEPRFAFDRMHVEQPWRLTGQGVDLTFDVGAVHAQKTNLLVVRSRFIQPVGSFRGTLNLDGHAIQLDDVPGVVEDQDVLW